MFRMALVWMFLAAPATPVKSSDYPALDRLAGEAEALKAEHPDQWEQDHERAERVFAENAKVVAAWRRRSAPPAPDLEPLKLPLAFLVEAVQREEQTGRRSSYLSAIVHHPDIRRIDVLLEYRDQLRRRQPDQERFHAWGQRIAEAATREWAAGQIPKLARQDPKLDLNNLPDSLLYGLTDRFARELPADVRAVAFDSLRKQYPYGPNSFDGERIWDVLLRLDARRARQEILPYFGTPSGAALRYNYHVVVLLHKHPGPSRELAAAARHWLATEHTLDAYHKRLLRVVLLRADPKDELEPTVRYIDQLLSEQKRQNARFAFGGDVHALVLALGDVEGQEAEAQLARYVFERTIDAGVRFLILETLARRRSATMPGLAARWLAEEQPEMQRHLRKEAAEKWGAYGREVLDQAERINARRMQKAR